MNRLVSGALAALALTGSQVASAVNLDDLPEDLFTRKVEVSFAPFGAETHTDFPALVRLSEERLPGFSYAQCAPDGADIRFFDEAGDAVPFEVDTWNPEGESKIWVRVAAFSSASRLTMCWGAAAPVVADLVAPEPAKVWTRYVGVWHMNDLENAGTNELSLTEKASPVRMTDAAHLGCAYSFVATNALWVSNPVTSNYLETVSKFAVSFWMNPRVNSTLQRLVGNKPRNGGSWSGFDTYWDASNNLYMRGEGNGSSVGSKNALALDTWFHLAFRYNNTSGGIFVDGELKKSGTVGAVSSQNRQMGIGNTGWASSYPNLSTDGFQGQIDEVRVFNGVPSDAWLKNEHDAVSSPEFQSFGEIQTIGAVIDPDDFACHAVFTVSETAPDDPSLTDFPVPVRLSRERVTNFRASRCGANGSGLRFAGPGGRILPYEVETWNPNGESLVWVRLASCRPGTVFTMNWGCRGTLPPTPAETSTWSKYAAVWHLNDLTDSTGHGYTLDDSVYPNGPVRTDDARLGGAYVFDPVKTNLLMTSKTINTDEYLNNTNVSQFTTTMWVRPRATTRKQILLTNKPPSAAGWTGFSVRVTNDGAGVVQGTTKENESWNYMYSILAPGVWRHVGARFDRRAMTLFADGVSKRSATLAEVPEQDAGGRCSIGGYAKFGNYKPGSDDGFDGVIDEVRVYNGPASDAWVRAEHDSVSEDFLSCVSDAKTTGLMILFR